MTQKSVSYQMLAGTGRCPTFAKGGAYVGQKDGRNSTTSFFTQPENPVHLSASAVPANIAPAMPASPLTLRNHLFRPGQRIAVAVSGGADSVALLQRLLEERPKLGIALSVVHVHHGIREAAGEDATFVE